MNNEIQPSQSLKSQTERIGTSDSKKSTAANKDRRSLRVLRPTLSSRSSTWNSQAADILTNSLYKQAMDFLREDVVQIIRNAFDVFAVDRSSIESEDDSSNNKPTISKKSSQSQFRRGVPYKDILPFLEEVGCHTSSETIKDEIFSQVGVNFSRDTSEYQIENAVSRSSFKAPSSIIVPDTDHLEIVGFEKILAVVWHFLVDEEVSDDNIRGAFNLFDIDDDGTLRANELAKVLKSLGSACPLKKEQVDEIFNRMDANKSGTINVKEFMHFFNKAELQRALDPLVVEPACDVRPLVKNAEDQLLDVVHDTFKDNSTIIAGFERKESDTNAD